MAKERSYNFPDFDQLPKIANAPQGCLWGFYDQDGAKDEIGSFNLLTSSVVKEASKEIQTGRHVQLDWPLHNQQFPGYNRKPFEHVIIDHKPLGICGFDDEIHMNTQSSSQWDGLKHDGCGGVFYNGLSYQQACDSTTNGTHNWCQRGGIVGRGILVDMVRYYESRDGSAPDPWTRFAIPLSDIKNALEIQGTKTKQGDILMVRSGYVKRHNEATVEERKACTLGIGRPSTGIDPDDDMIRWLYDQHFAAHVGDTVSFEVWPASKHREFSFHNWSLVWWGTPLGELWDLESLAKECVKHGRWSFFFTSAPLHVLGGVASPPCAIAIF